MKEISWPEVAEAATEYRKIMNPQNATIRAVVEAVNAANAEEEEVDTELPEYEYEM